MRWVVSYALIVAQVAAWALSMGADQTAWLTVAVVLLLVWLWWMAYTSKHNVAGGDIYL